MTAPGMHEQSSVGGGGGGMPASVPQLSSSPMHGPQVANSLSPLTLQIWSPSWHMPMLRSAAGPVQHAAVSPLWQEQPSFLYGRLAAQSLSASVVPPPCVAGAPAVPGDDAA